MRTISKEYVRGIYASDDHKLFESHFDEMKKSDSKDIYVHTRCHRETIRLTQSMLHESSDESAHGAAARDREAPRRPGGPPAVHADDGEPCAGFSLIESMR